MSQISITQVVNVTVAQAPSGLGAYHVNNLAILTAAEPTEGFASGLPYKVYYSAADVIADFTGTDDPSIQLKAMATLVFSQSPNILDGDGALIVFPTPDLDGTDLETWLTSAFALKFFGGAIYSGWTPTDVQVVAAATYAQSVRVKLFCVSNDPTAITSPTGLFKLLKDANLDHARGFFYGMDNYQTAQLNVAAYASRAMSVNFDGSNTTATMHLKDLVGVAADTTVDDNLLYEANNAGADTYIAIGGLAKVYCSNGNDFWDNVYNLDWLVFALQVAGFNALATTNTKLPQTEVGMSVLKGAYISVLQQSISNGFVAPGSWTSTTLFGNPADLRRNISSIGYYIYSQPVTQQNQVAREARQAPLVQIAIKFAGAIHSSNVIVYFNR